MTARPPLKLDKYNRQIYSEQDAVDALYDNPELDLSKLNLEDVEQFNYASKLLYAGIKLERATDLDCTPEKFHAQNQNNWHMPEEYKNFDIAKWCLNQCENEEQIQRAGKGTISFSTLHNGKVACKFLTLNRANLTSSKPMLTFPSVLSKWAFPSFKALYD